MSEAQTIEFIHVYNPNAHLIGMGWVDSKSKAKVAAVLDRFQCLPGNNKIEAAKLERILQGCKKSAEWFSKDRPSDRRCRVVGSPVTEKAPAKKTIEAPLPVSLIGFDLAESEDFIARTTDIEVLINWGKGLDDTEGDDVQTIRDALMTKIRLLQEPAKS